TVSQTQSELASNMHNNNDGNWDDEELGGKAKYIKDHNLPLEVHYTGGVMAPHGAGAGNYMSSNGRARNDGPISWDWLQNEMAKGQDIELMTNTHWVVVEATYSWGGIKQFLFRDDPYQHGSMTTAQESANISNSHTWSYFNNGHIDIGSG